ncbi:MAG: site-specific DNA-methyltransferase, partial [Candidatus Levybacteria bacterium]|nr:site-specific DNA-methyltransferase [Candidatus Levybacteria bacterium]
MSKQLVSIKEASQWASNLLSRDITPSNISYLIQYGKIKKYLDQGFPQIDLDDLRRYYDSFRGRREVKWKEKLGNDINWSLSFDHLREKDTTKHVHRLHPYKGKYIPQLVEYFLGSHTDEFKRHAYFKKGDIVLDPFVGSGTTLVQANEFGMHTIGIDISRFNCLISEVKLIDYDLTSLAKEIINIKDKINSFENDKSILGFEEELSNKLYDFNNVNFPSPAFKYRVNRQEINEEEYGSEKEKKFLQMFENLVKKYDIHLAQNKKTTFLDKWYTANTRLEIDYIF